MRYLIDYFTDRRIGIITDQPPLSMGTIVRLGEKNYRVLNVSTNRKVPEIYISSRKDDVFPLATPDYTLELIE